MHALNRVLNLEGALLLEVLVDLDATATLTDGIVIAVRAPHKLQGTVIQERWQCG